ncbi:MAG: hypothetical protein QOK42_2142 [Frankiaceae bacterium]|nr:hypothetical protein [Frankiaceae bacterium]MDX6225176.1 hypothetical protein [Frankiales bacterium]
MWRRGETDPQRNGHPLYVFPRQGAGRVDDPEREYAVLYACDSAAGAVAEALGDYARWTPAVLAPPPAAPRGSALALVQISGEPEILDLDDPSVLVKEALRPSGVVSRDRTATQAWARRIHDRGRHAGVSWWSYRDPRWAAYGIWDRAALSVARTPEPLTMDHPAVLEAASVLPRVMRG